MKLRAYLVTGHITGNRQQKIHTKCSQLWASQKHNESFVPNFFPDFRILSVLFVQTLVFKKHHKILKGDDQVIQRTVQLFSLFVSTNLENLKNLLAYCEIYLKIKDELSQIRNCKKYRVSYKIFEPRIIFRTTRR